ncbi:rubrerythrin family protein [Aphanothece hegewaldii CCALA 016]|uniref:Rubrerythrin family protein n=1 Tax=Aphanothece hegewaldii CCALA 016 TaxID=2107694 RepID=A0A2T1LSC3_9CHRO|nr:ferritin-like domain-containing protein [Aphanothece hegewaldii]PSF32645.1 rubrerythrin family protein [Aphanothece hegewaldii CCALA 016]
MNLYTSILHTLGSGATAFIMARNLCDPQTRPNTLASLQLAESGAVPFLETLQQRAIQEGDQWLAEKLARHASDERRHGQIFAQALKRMGKEVIDPKQLAQQNSQERRSPFFDAFFDGYTREELKADNIDWAVFMGSTYILELDACNDFFRMARVLGEKDAALKKGIFSVAQDEKGHAAYLYEAMQRRLSTPQVETLIDEWRTRKINAVMAMVKNYIEKGTSQRSLVTEGTPNQAEMELASVA